MDKNEWGEGNAKRRGGMGWIPGGRRLPRASGAVREVKKGVFGVPLEEPEHPVSRH
jgi:hypothetical protein